MESEQRGPLWEDGGGDVGGLSGSRPGRGQGNTGSLLETDAVLGAADVDAHSSDGGAYTSHTAPLTGVARAPSPRVHAALSVIHSSSP